MECVSEGKQNILPDMVYLISGRKNEGKTTKLKRLYEGKKNAFGFISEKVNDCGRFTTYNLVDLTTGDKRILAKLASLPLPEDWGEDFNHGPFRFSLSGFEWARKLFVSAADAGAENFFIDELGKLELDGKGHAELIRSALASGIDLYISIRNINVEEAVKIFGMKDHTIIKVG